ncbi:hypothetical protein [Actinophytocola sediminis]
MTVAVPSRLSVDLTPAMASAVTDYADRERVSHPEALRRLVAAGTLMYRTIRTDGDEVLIRRAAGNEKITVVRGRIGVAKSSAWTMPQAREMRRRYEEGASALELADQYLTTPNTVRDALVAAGATIRTPRRSTTNPKMDQELRERYERGDSMAVLSEVYELTDRAVARALIRTGATIRPPGGPVVRQVVADTSPLLRGRGG